MFLSKLKELREEKKYTRAEVAALLSVDSGEYGRYEDGNKDISVAELLTLCEIYNVSSDYILGLRRDRGEFLQL